MVTLMVNNFFVFIVYLTVASSQDVKWQFVSVSFRGPFYLNRVLFKYSPRQTAWPIIACLVVVYLDFLRPPLVRERQSIAKTTWRTINDYLLSRGMGHSSKTLNHSSVRSNIFRSFFRKLKSVNEKWTRVSRLRVSVNLNRSKGILSASGNVLSY